MWIEDKLRASWAILVYVWLLGFAMFARILCLPPIAHILKEELSLSHGQVGLIYALPLGILAAISVPSGLLADRIGIRKVGGTDRISGNGKWAGAILWIHRGDCGAPACGIHYGCYRGSPLDAHHSWWCGNRLGPYCFPLTRNGFSGQDEQNQR